MLLIKRFSSSFKRIVTIPNATKPGDALNVQGWIKNIRRLKNNIFLDINDGSTSNKFQVVLPKNEQIQNITTGSIVRCAGRIQIAPNGQYELHAEDVKTVSDGALAAGYPFTPKQKHAADYVREYLHLRARVDSVAAQLRLRHQAQRALNNYMDTQGFVQINTPLLTTNDCEGAGEIFRVQPDSKELLKQMARQDVPLELSYFNSKVYLSVSGQLHLEAMTYGLGNTYTLSPAFRAENCKSPLHLAEFYMFEAELAYMEDIKALTSFIEQMLKGVTKDVLSASAADLSCCQRNAQGQTFELSWLDSNWTTLSYDEAVEIVIANKDKFKTKVTPEDGFSKEQELFLVAHCDTPVFIVDWPAIQKPFYMKVSRTKPDRVHALDLLMPVVGELCGGSLREFDVQRLSAHPKFPKGLDWYLDIRKFGGIPTGGFGMGFERYLQLLTGVKNIRDVIPFPRYPHSCKM